MKPKTDKELADEVDARKRLEKNGYRRVTCKSCNGFKGDDGYCMACGGKGYHWESPLMC